MTRFVAAVPDFVPNMDPRLFSDDYMPELVLELMLAIAREGERPTSRAAS